MASLGKIAEAIAVFGQKREEIVNVMKVVVREWEGLEKNSRTIQAELESKQKHCLESVQSSSALLNSKKRFLEEGLEKLDGKVKFVREVLKEVEAGQAQCVVMRDFVDQQLKELALKEQQIQHFSESILRDVEKKEKELANSVEKSLKKRKDEMDCELQTRKASLVEQESLIALKERTLVERESEFARKQKTWESELETRKVFLVERETAVVSKEMDVELREKLLEKRETELMDLARKNTHGKESVLSKELGVKLKEKLLEKKETELMDLAPKNTHGKELGSCTVTKSPQGILMEGNRRAFGDGSTGEVFVKGSLRHCGKRQRSGDRPHPNNSGSNDKIIVVDDSEEEGADELSKRQALRKLLEPLEKDQIMELLKEAESENQSIPSLILQRAADCDPAQRKLFVHGFSWETTELQLRAVFAPYGAIEDLKLVTGKVTGKLMGFAFVLYKSVFSAHMALKHPYVRIGNRTVCVQLAAASPSAKAADAGQKKKLSVKNPNAMASYGSQVALRGLPGSAHRSSYFTG